MLQKSGPFCHELNYFYISTRQRGLDGWDEMLPRWLCVCVFSEELWQWFHFICCLSLSLGKHNLHSECSVPQPHDPAMCRLFCLFYSVLFAKMADEFGNFSFFLERVYCEQSPEQVRSEVTTDLYNEAYICTQTAWEIRGELGLTQVLVSELITTSLWAKNSKGFLAYHRLNYRGGEWRGRGHHTAVWQHGRKRHCLGRNYTCCPPTKRAALQ